MTVDRNAAFVGSVPESYDRELGPMWFQPFAEDLAKRIGALAPRALLETACGTGISTRAILGRLPADARLTATDLNQPMIDYARRAVDADPRLEWRTADMTALPFGDGGFDAMACQFGMMFAPDKAAAAREARRVLRHGGSFVFSVWDSMAHNPIAAIADRVVGELFPSDPPPFYRTPYGYHDRDTLTGLARTAGFGAVALETVRLPVERPSARSVALGLIEGQPIRAQIVERGGEPGRVVDAMERALVRELGDAPMRTSMQALVVTARA